MSGIKREWGSWRKTEWKRRTSEGGPEESEQTESEEQVRTRVSHLPHVLEDREMENCEGESRDDDWHNDHSTCAALDHVERVWR